jgi:DNA-binding CsgD family transcriptional regulator
MDDFAMGTKKSPDRSRSFAEFTLGGSEGLGMTTDTSGRHIGTMKRTVLLYGILGGVLIAALKMIEFRFLVVEHSLEIYGGLVALLFSALGLWLGLKLTRPREIVVVREVPVPVHVPANAFERDPARVNAFGITPRELEILELMAEGHSTREMAERLFVSENTVKTHTGRLFDKLSARRRTQAVRRAKEEGLIP